MKNPREIKLVINQVLEYHPEPREWATVKGPDGKEHPLMPSITLSVIPLPPGWQAVFVDTEKEGEVYRKPVAALSLELMEEGEQLVRTLCSVPGMEGRLGSAEDEEEYIGIEGPGEVLDWTEEVLYWWEEHSNETRALKDYDIHPHSN